MNESIDSKGDGTYVIYNYTLDSIYTFVNCCTIEGRTLCDTITLMISSKGGDPYLGSNSIVVCRSAEYAVFTLSGLACTSPTYSLPTGFSSSDSTITIDPTVEPGTYVISVCCEGCCEDVSVILSDIRTSGNTIGTTCGQNNGQINIFTVTGGTAPYTCDWSHLPGSNDPQSVSGLAPGDYTITITDANKCSTTFTETIGSSKGITGTSGSLTNTTCGLDNGTITINSVMGGTAPYTYDW